jgi:glucose/arabinose dehydrogenase
MLRIDVNRRFRYAIPPSNPFVGVRGVRREIWAAGLRNPWRFSFDRLTGDLYIADVGQSSWEEVNHQPAASPGGENYGWRLMEGNHCFNPASDCDDGTLVPPIVEYNHTEGCSVTGGYVYRGSLIPALFGTYLLGDFCTGVI